MVRPHVVLLGDSIFDNGAYVAPRPDVIRQLRTELGGTAAATLLALDGAVTRRVHEQLQRLPTGATHLVISVGGNDALGYSSLFTHAASTIGEAVTRLADARARFEADYRSMAAAVLELDMPTAFCTIYDANYTEPQRTLVVTGLTLFNDVITRAAFEMGADLIDLRIIASEPSDYANPIEPSAGGGEKIVRAISSFVQASRSRSAPSQVFLR
jgi:lysophospholipase L1-like esterase